MKKLHHPKRVFPLLGALAAIALLTTGCDTFVGIGTQAEEACTVSYVRELRPDPKTFGTKFTGYWVTCQDGSVHYLRPTSLIEDR